MRGSPLSTLYLAMASPVTDQWGERLPRHLGLWSAIAVLVGSTIGSGIFRVPAGVAQRLHDPGPVVVAWLIGGAVWLLWLKGRGTRLEFSRALWILALAGAGAVLTSFMIDHRLAFVGPEPPPFRWGLFALGVAMGVMALAAGSRRMRRG